MDIYNKEFWQASDKIETKTNIYFVHHAQLDISIVNDMLHKLTEKGMADAKLIT